MHRAVGWHMNARARRRLSGAALVASVALALSGCSGANTASSNRQSGTHIDSTGWSQQQKFSSLAEVPQDLACAGPDLCLAVFGSSVLIWKAGHWSKSSLEVPGLGNNLEFQRATCPTSTECFVVASGSNGSLRLARTVFLTYRNGVWSSPTMLTGSDYYGITCLTATDCIAVGWIPPPIPTSKSPALSGLPAIARYDGQSWTQEPQLPGTSERTGGLFEATCTGSDFCLATDGGGDALVIDGSSLKVTQPFPGDTDEDEVACANPDLCLALNAGGFEISVFDGSRWTVDSVDPNALTTIGCSPTTCYAGDSNGNLEWTLGGSWSKPTKIGSSAIAAISCPEISFCMAATSKGYYMTMTLPAPD